MKAARVNRINEKLEITDVDRPQVSSGTVLLRTLACGICRTDLHVSCGVAYHPDLPHIPGHEPAGEIVEIGKGVTGWAIGDRAVPYLFEYSAEKDAKTDATKMELSVLGVTRNGAFAEYFLARAENLVRIPDGVPPEFAGLASCAGVTAIHAIDRACIARNERLAIIGAGGIGALIIQILRPQSIHVTAIDLRRENLELAKSEGADEALLVQDVLDTPELAFDRVIDMVGNSKSTSLAEWIVRDKGRIVIVGEESQSVDIDTATIAQRELEIVGSRNGSMADVAKALELMSQGILVPRIDQVIKLDDVNVALDTMANGKSNGRFVISFED